MKKLNILIAIYIVLFASNTYGIDRKNQLLRELIDVGGLKKIVEDSKTKEFKNTDYQANKLLEVLMDKYPDLPRKYQIMAHKEYKKYAYSVAASYTVEEAIEKWIEIYDGKFSEGELIELINFYKSGVGKKSVELAIEGNEKYTKFVYSKINAGTKLSYPDLDLKISKIISNYQKEKVKH